MRKVICACLFLLFFSPATVAIPQGSLDQRVAELSDQISKEMTEQKKTTIAVVEFSDLDGNITALGKYLAEELITRLFQTKKFKVIERQLLRKVIAEQKLSLTGVVDPASAKQLGKILGVDAIASGSITDLAQSLRVNARLISTETGEIFAVASTEIFKDESVTRLMGAGGTVPSANPTQSVTATQPTMPKQTASVAGGIAPGMKFEFKDKVWEVEKQIRVSLVSVEFSDKNMPKVGLTIENLRDSVASAYFYNAKVQTYILDQTGQSYPFKEVSFFSTENYRDIPPGVPIKFFITFDAMPASTTEIGLVVYIYGLGNYTATFRNVKLK